MPTLEERLIAKVTAGKPEPSSTALVPTDPLSKPKPLVTNSKINVTGKSQSYEDLCKALGIPVKKKG